MIHRVSAALLVVAATACAREEPPPGTQVDNTPPRLVSTVPEDGTVTQGLDDPLVLRFDEPVEERNGLQRQLRASPAYRYRVEFGFSTVEIEPREGWRPGAVYFFHVPPPFSDLLGNRTEGAVEVTFSTGPPVTATRVEGTVLDRVEGRPARSARVLFYRTGGDSVPYTAVQDTGETFALRALPPGRYRAYAFRDLNGNMRLEARLEAHDSTTFELDGPDATASLRLAVVEPDSTPPVLASASARDSQLVELRFDDPLDPEQDFGRVEVVVRDTATGRAWPVAAVGLTEAQVGRGDGAPPAGTPGPGAVPEPPTRDTAPVGPDTATVAADEPAVPDTVAGAADGVRAAPRDTVGAPGDTAGPAARRDTAPLPSRTALVRLSRALEVGGVYRVRADRFLNLRGLAGGGDTLLIHTAPADTAGAPADTAVVPADTARRPSP